MGVRGPKPDRELEIARAWSAAQHVRLEDRPTSSQVATRFHVTVRQVQRAYKKHRDQVEREWVLSMSQQLTERLSAQDDRSPADRVRYRDDRDARGQYELGLAQRRAALKARRAKKKTPS